MLNTKPINDETVCEIVALVEELISLYEGGNITRIEMINHFLREFERFGTIVDVPEKMALCSASSVNHFMTWAYYKTGDLIFYRD